MGGHAGLYVGILLILISVSSCRDTNEEDETSSEETDKSEEPTKSMNSEEEGKTTPKPRGSVTTKSPKVGSGEEEESSEESEENSVENLKDIEKKIEGSGEGTYEKVTKKDEDYIKEILEEQKESLGKVEIKDQKKRVHGKKTVHIVIIKTEKGYNCTVVISKIEESEDINIYCNEDNLEPTTKPTKGPTKPTKRPTTRVTTTKKPAPKTTVKPSCEVSKKDKKIIDRILEKEKGKLGAVDIVDCKKKVQGKKTVYIVLSKNPKGSSCVVVITTDGGKEKVKINCEDLKPTPTTVATKKPLPRTTPKPSSEESGEEGESPEESKEPEKSTTPKKSGEEEESPEESEESKESTTPKGSEEKEESPEDSEESEESTSLEITKEDVKHIKDILDKEKKKLGKVQKIISHKKKALGDKTVHIVILKNSKGSTCAVVITAHNGSEQVKIKCTEKSSETTKLTTTQKPLRTTPKPSKVESCKKDKELIDGILEEQEGILGKVDIISCNKMVHGRKNTFIVISKNAKGSICTIMIKQRNGSNKIKIICNEPESEQTKGTTTKPSAEDSGEEKESQEESPEDSGEEKESPEESPEVTKADKDHIDDILKEQEGTFGKLKVKSIKKDVHGRKVTFIVISKNPKGSICTLVIAKQDGPEKIKIFCRPGKKGTNTTKKPQDFSKGKKGINTKKPHDPKTQDFPKQVDDVDREHMENILKRKKKYGKCTEIIFYKKEVERTENTYVMICKTSKDDTCTITVKRRDGREKSSVSCEKGDLFPDRIVEIIIEMSHITTENPSLKPRYDKLKSELQRIADYDKTHNKLPDDFLKVIIDLLVELKDHPHLYKLVLPLIKEIIVKLEKNQVSKLPDEGKIGIVYELLRRLYLIIPRVKEALERCKDGNPSNVKIDMMKWLVEIVDVVRKKQETLPVEMIDLFKKSLPLLSNCREVDWMLLRMIESIIAKKEGCYSIAGGGSSPLVTFLHRLEQIMGELNIQYRHEPNPEYYEVIRNAIGNITLIYENNGNACPPDIWRMLPDRNYFTPGYGIIIDKIGALLNRQFETQVPKVAHVVRNNLALLVDDGKQFCSTAWNDPGTLYELENILEMSKQDISIISREADIILRILLELQNVPNTYCSGRVALITQQMKVVFGVCPCETCSPCQPNPETYKPPPLTYCPPVLFSAFRYY